MGVFTQKFVAFADLLAVSGFVVPDVKVGPTFDDRNMTEPLVKRLESRLEYIRAPNPGLDMAQDTITLSPPSLPLSLANDNHNVRDNLIGVSSSLASS